MPISGCHNLPLATFNLPSRKTKQTNSAPIKPVLRASPPSCAAPERVKESPKTKKPKPLPHQRAFGEDA